MLLWESILNSRRQGKLVSVAGSRRCAALTKSGRPCKGKARPESAFCLFHDPDVDRAALRSAAEGKPRSERRTRYHVAGVPSRLTTRRGITLALDQLYADTLEGRVSPETGRALFHMLEQLLGAYQKSRPRKNPYGTDRSRAAALCRKLARKYVTTMEKEREKEADGHLPKERLDPATIRLPLFEPDPPVTIPFPGALAQQA